MNVQKTKRKAKKIVFLGALSALLTGAITGLPAVFMGHRELSKYTKDKTLYSEGERRVIVGGITLGYIGIILSIYLIILALAGFFRWNIIEIINISTR